MKKMAKRAVIEGRYLYRKLAFSYCSFDCFIFYFLIDLREKRIPNELVFVIVVLGVYIFIVRSTLSQQFRRGNLFFSSFYHLHFFFPRMGLGDVKLAGALDFSWVGKKHSCFFCSLF
jgi:Flp pilus assembly protein protease CpaA